MLFVIVLVLAVALFAGAAILSSYLARKRREELAAQAQRLGLAFSQHDPFELASRYGYLAALSRGDNRYAFNVAHGEYRGRRAMWFDYHYETHTHDSKGRRRTHHYYFSAALVPVETRFPRLVIRPEGLFDKLAGAVGFDDIDFESAEFSRRFYVQSEDRKFAYDIVHARAMELLLDRACGGVGFELSGDAVLLYAGERWKAEQAPGALDLAVEFVGLIPAYVWDDLRLKREP